MNTNITPITHEAHLINYQFLSLVRNGVSQAPDLISSIMGIDQETAKCIAELTPMELDKIAKSPMLYFKPRLDKKMLQEMMRAAHSNNQAEIDCNLQQAAALV